MDRRKCFWKLAVQNTWVKNVFKKPETDIIDSWLYWSKTLWPKTFNKKKHKFDIYTVVSIKIKVLLKIVIQFCALDSFLVIGWEVALDKLNSSQVLLDSRPCFDWFRWAQLISREINFKLVMEDQSDFKQSIPFEFDLI